MTILALGPICLLCGGFSTPDYFLEQFDELVEGHSALDIARRGPRKEGDSTLGPKDDLSFEFGDPRFIQVHLAHLVIGASAVG